jgi:hypothetical protein
MGVALVEQTVKARVRQVGAENVEGRGGARLDNDGTEMSTHCLGRIGLAAKNSREVAQQSGVTGGHLHLDTNDTLNAAATMADQGYLLRSRHGPSPGMTGSDYSRKYCRANFSGVARTRAVPASGAPLTNQPERRCKPRENERTDHRRHHPSINRGWRERLAARSAIHASRRFSPCCSSRHLNWAKRSWPKNGSPLKAIIGTP